MLSKYFKLKIKTKEFDINVKNKVSKLKDKKVLVCGDYEQFMELNKQYKFEKFFTITSILHIGKDSSQIKKSQNKIINLNQINDEDFDLILICDEFPEKIHDIISEHIKKSVQVEYLFNQQIDEYDNISFAIRNRLDKRIKHLSKKLKNKKVYFYGAGAFFCLLNDFYDLSPINALGIIDKKAEVYDKEHCICGYKMFSPQEIKDLNPDYIILTTRYFSYAARSLYKNVLKGTNIQIIPLVKTGLLGKILYF